MITFVVLTILFALQTHTQMYLVGVILERWKREREKWRENEFFWCLVGVNLGNEIGGALIFFLWNHQNVSSQNQGRNWKENWPTNGWDVFLNKNAPFYDILLFIFGLVLFFCLFLFVFIFFILFFHLFSFLMFSKFFFFFGGVFF